MSLSGSDLLIYVNTFSGGRTPLRFFPRPSLNKKTSRVVLWMSIKDAPDKEWFFVR